MFCGYPHAMADEADMVTIKAVVLDACTGRPLENVLVCAEFAEGNICGSTNSRGRSETTFAIPSRGELTISATLGNGQVFYSSAKAGIAEPREYNERFVLAPRKRPCVR